MEKIAIFIPVYNEEETLAKVLEKIPQVILGHQVELIIVDDCSTDNSAQIAKQFTPHIIILRENGGVGIATKKGFEYIANRGGYEFVIKFDGDGQHLASEIKILLDPILHNEADVVIGSRYCEKQNGFRSTPLRRRGIKVFEILNSLLIKQRITDNTSGFRAYCKKAIHFLAENYPDDYPEPEAVLMLGKNGFGLKEVPVCMQERMRGNSSITGIKSGYYMIKVLLAVLVNAMRPRIVKD